MDEKSGLTFMWAHNGLRPGCLHPATAISLILSEAIFLLANGSPIDVGLIAFWNFCLLVVIGRGRARKMFVALVLYVAVWGAVFISLIQRGPDILIATGSCWHETEHCATQLAELIRQCGLVLGRSLLRILLFISAVGFLASTYDRDKSSALLLRLNTPVEILYYFYRAEMALSEFLLGAKEAIVLHELQGRIARTRREKFWLLASITSSVFFRTSARVEEADCALRSRLRQVGRASRVMVSLAPNFVDSTVVIFSALVVAALRYVAR